LPARVILGSSFGLLAASRVALAQSAPAAGDAPAEVTVRGKKPGPLAGAETVSTGDARAIPGTFGDAFQALAALPGIAPMASGLPFFYVRGAPPADTGYFIDGIPVPTLFHIGPGASVVPQALVDHVDFFPGGAPARYGRFVGGIIAGQTTEPRAEARGEASVRLFDASAFVEQPLDGASSVALGGRYGYPNLLLSIFAPTLSLHFGDYTFRWTRSLTDTDRISLFALGGYDHEEDKTQSLVPIDSEFHRVDLRYDHKRRRARVCARS
jgi:outer membrane receptor protein involved in Fe transport